MTPGDADTPRRRLGFAFDASPSCLAVGETVLRLAKRMEADLSVLYVEDDMLSRLARHPGVRTLSSPPLGAGPMDGDSVSLYLKSHGNSVQTSFEKLSRLCAFTPRFERLQGNTVEALKEAGSALDFLFLGGAVWTHQDIHQARTRMSRSAARRIRRLLIQSEARPLGATIRGLMHAPPCPLVILRSDISPERPLSVLFDGSEAAGKTLAFAANLLKNMDISRETPRGPGEPRTASPQILCLLPAQNEKEAFDLRLSAERILSEKNAKSAFQAIPALPDPAAGMELLGRALKEVAGTILVHDTVRPLAGHTPLSRIPAEILKGLPCSFLLLPTETS